MLPDDFVRLWGLLHVNICRFKCHLIAQFIDIIKVFVEIFALFQSLFKGVQDRGFISFCSHDNNHLITLNVVIINFFSLAVNFFVQMLLNNFQSKL